MRATPLGHFGMIFDRVAHFGKLFIVPLLRFGADEDMLYLRLDQRQLSADLRLNNVIFSRFLIWVQQFTFDLPAARQHKQVGMGLRRDDDRADQNQKSSDGESKHDS
jgi:hypothetical protein